MNNSISQVFYEESAELLEQLETSLLQLENSPQDGELIAQVFRALHTIKGSSGMFGYDKISNFTHNIENIYEHIRNGRMQINKQIIDLTLAAKDQIGLMLEGPRGEGNADEKTINKITDAFGKLAGQINLNNTAEKASKKKEQIIKPEKSDPGETDKTVYFIKFKPGEDIFLSGTNPVLLLNELKEQGEILITPHFNRIPSFEELKPEKNYIAWDIIVKTDKGLNAVKDVFIFVEDSCEIDIKELDKGEISNDLNYYYELINRRDNDLKNNTAEEMQIDQDKIEDRKDEKRKTRFENYGSQNISSVRINADKLDLLVNLVGELVTVQARLSQTAVHKKDADIIAIAEDMERLTWELRDNALSVRMIPIESTFNKFKRLIRDLSGDLGKEVELITEGGETELDKNVIEKLNDPLVHIIRNCVDHGIEQPEERIKKNKLSTGSVILSAVHSGTHVLIVISDDGRGLDKEKIYEKAVEKGLINKDSDLTEKEIFNLIFEPGFSTAKEVTSVSGRGVGMDVVKKSVEALRGTVEISSGESGTTITLKLPLTLAIIDGLLVKIEEDFYILPLTTVEECIELSGGDIKKTHGRQIISVRGDIIPYINLRKKFGIEKMPPVIQQIAIANMNGVKAGFVVDQVIGQHQTVLKSLGRYYKNVGGISGATILGNGDVALILDIKKLLEEEEVEASVKS